DESRLIHLKVGSIPREDVPALIADVADRDGQIVHQLMLNRDVVSHHARHDERQGTSLAADVIGKWKAAIRIRFPEIGESRGALRQRKYSGKSITRAQILLG